MNIGANMEKNEILRNKIVTALKAQGFDANSNTVPSMFCKEDLRRLHLIKRNEQLSMHKTFLKNNFDLIGKHIISGKDLAVKKIELRLIEVKPNSFYSKFFFWWNLYWWSILYNKPIGRLLNFILWDEYHQAPFGLFCLQSPPLKSSARDSFLGLSDDKSNYWINQSLYGQRIGALPPYNELLGGKLVTLSIVSNEVRNIYAMKYKNKMTIMKNRCLPNRLLFVTTTSAFGKSSVYERIYYKDVLVSQFIGYTSGAGTFQLPESLYEDCVKYLNQNGIDTKRGFGTGTSRKLRLVERAFRYLGIGDYCYHNIKRGCCIL
jgi:hypothetical protein